MNDTLLFIDSCTDSYGWESSKTKGESSRTKMVLRQMSTIDQRYWVSTEDTSNLLFF